MLAKPINVLHVVLSFRPGGRRNAITTLAASLPDSVTNHLCCVEELGSDSSPIHKIFRSVSSLDRRLGQSLFAGRRLRARCLEHEIDLIHSHDAASQYVATFARLGPPRFKALMTFHRTLAFESAGRRSKLRNALCGVLSQAIVTPSIERKRHFLSENAVPERKVVVIPFGVDLQRFRRDAASRTELRGALGIAERTVVVGAIGHFGPEKGIDQAIRAFNACTSMHPELDVALIILGAGRPERQSTIRRLSDERRSRGIYFAGFQADVERWLSAFDVFLHAPRMEAFGLVVIEAMACELPVVATGVGSMPEIVRDGETGFVVAPGSEELLAAALARLAQSRDLRDKFASRGRQIAHAEYSSQLCAERYAALYRGIHRGDPLANLKLIERERLAAEPAIVAGF